MYPESVLRKFLKQSKVYMEEEFRKLKDKQKVIDCNVCLVV